MSFENINPEQIDVLREIGNIGAGNAATALAGILNRRISMSVPDVRFVPFNDITNILNGPETIVVGLLVNFSGDMSGFILMVLDMKDAFEMVSIAMGDSRATPDDLSGWQFNEVELSALTEMANILVGSYLSAICSLSGLTVKASVPEMAIDMVGAIMSIVVIEYGKIGDSVLFMKTKFSDPEMDMNGHFFLIPDYESYKILMKSLGLEI